MVTSDVPTPTRTRQLPANRNDHYVVLAKANRNGRHWQLKSLRWTVEDAFQLPLDDRRHRPTWRDLGIAGL